MKFWQKEHVLEVPCLNWHVKKKSKMFWKEMTRGCHTVQCSSLGFFFHAAGQSSRPQRAWEPKAAKAKELCRILTAEANSLAEHRQPRYYRATIGLNIVPGEIHSQMKHRPFTHVSLVLCRNCSLQFTHVYTYLHWPPVAYLVFMETSPVLGPSRCQKRWPWAKQRNISSKNHFAEESARAKESSDLS